MLKRHFISLLLLVLATLVTNAGTWKTHSAFVTSKIENIYDAGDKVYYLNSGNLFQYDKNTQTTISLGRQNILTDNKVSQIYYDWEYDLLFIAYMNSNIDVIDGNGKVTNISNIKNMVVPLTTFTLDNGKLSEAVSKAINDITFSHGVAYVSVGYGFVTIDETTLRVIKNYHMGNNITVYSAGRFGDTMYVISSRYCYYGDPNASDPRNDFVRVSGTFDEAKTYPIDDHSIFVLTGGLYNYDFSSGTPTLTRLVNAKPTSVQKTGTGFISNFAGQSYYYTISANGKTATKVGTTVAFGSSNPNGDGTVWICDANGLHISGSTDYHKVNTMTTAMGYWMKYNAAMDKLYLGLSGPNMVTTSVQNYANVVNTYDGSKWTDVSYSATGGGYEFVFNPADPTTYFRGSWKAGLHRVTNNVLKLTYNSTNAPLGTYKPAPAFDKYGNLWVVVSYGAASNPVSVLTKDKLNKTTSSKSDWFIPSGINTNTRSMQKSRFIVSKKNNIKIFSDCDYPDGPVTGRFLCWDNGNEDPTVDNYRFVSISNFIDQFNKQVDWVHLSHFEEDNEGLIWVAHDMGLFVLDPDVLFDEHPRVTRPYVTKSSEGKGYLCEGFSVYDIGVDRDNNKWIACNDGLYFTSPDASEIYNHFTIENSDIPSNTVYGVECDTVNNRVYIVTDNGFAEYIVNGDAAALDFNSVYAFPNPVEPDFTGMVKIANLMDNSYVTIADRDGNVVAQMGPVMGSALWDGSGANGERVATGLYYIYAAQGAQPALTGEPLTTIMIIK
jgi:hypothetical protein